MGFGGKTSENTKISIVQIKKQKKINVGNLRQRKGETTDKKTKQEKNGTNLVKSHLERQVTLPRSAISCREVHQIPFSRSVIIDFL